MDARCEDCHRPLRDPDSRARGKGPVCLRKAGTHAAPRPRRPRRRHATNQIPLDFRPERTHPVTAFYLAMDCDNCAEPMLHGLCLTTEEHNGHPVIPFDIAAQATFECADCGTKHHTGDFDDIHTEITN